MVVLKTSYAIGPAYTYGGLVIINSSVSKGVQPIPRYNWSDPNPTNLVQYAEKLAELLDQGFKIKNIQAPGQWENGQTVTLVR